MIAGGKFANGAASGAFVHLFNTEFNRYMLGIHSNVSSKGSFSSGHAWISIYDKITGKFNTYGLWATESGLSSNGSGGVFENLELYKNYSFESNLLVDISEVQYDKISGMLESGSDTWYVTHTCADYARDVFYKASGTYLNVDDYFGIETPRKLAESIGN